MRESLKNHSHYTMYNDYALVTMSEKHANQQPNPNRTIQTPR